MEDDERTMDWAARKTAKNKRAAEKTDKANERIERDARLKDAGRLGLFNELHAWMEVQAKSYGTSPTDAFEVGKIQQVGGPDPHDYFNVTNTNRERWPMKITSYRSAPHDLLVECGGVPKSKYLLSVGDRDNLFFATKQGQPKTVADLGSELLDYWERAAI